METNVSNYHPIGSDPESYHSGALVEAVTLKAISPSELIGRYNLMLERIAEQARRIEQARNLVGCLLAITSSPSTYDMCDAWLSATAPAPRESENTISG